MSAPFDLNELSQNTDEELNWSQISQVLCSQEPFTPNRASNPMHSQGFIPSPPPSLSRAFSHASRPSFLVPPSIMRPLAETPPLPSPLAFRSPTLQATQGSHWSLPVFPMFEHAPLQPQSPSPTSSERLCSTNIDIFDANPARREDQHANFSEEHIPGNTEIVNEVTVDRIGQPKHMRQPSRTREDNAKDKTGDSRSSNKQSKAKDRRKKLAEGEASTYRDHWTTEDFKVLADARLRLDTELKEARGRHQFLSLDERWRRVSAWCKEDKVNKTPLQCRDKWENTFPRFKKIRDWDKAVPSGQNSYALMSSDERLEGGFPKTFDMTIYEILESRFGVDVLVDPGPILMDTSADTLDNLNSTATGGTSSSDPSGAGFSTPSASGAGAATASGEASQADPSSSGKRRARGESRQTSIRRDFQDQSKQFIEEMRISQREMAEQQQRQVDIQRRQLEELLSLQARQVQATETQLQQHHETMQTLTGFLGAYLSRQAPPPP